MQITHLLDQFPFAYLGDLLRAWHSVRGIMVAVPSAEDLRAIASMMVETSLETQTWQARPDYGLYAGPGPDGKVYLAFTPLLSACALETKPAQENSHDEQSSSAGRRRRPA